MKMITPVCIDQSSIFLFTVVNSKLFLAQYHEQRVLQPGTQFWLISFQYHVLKLVIFSLLVSGAFR